VDPDLLPPGDRYGLALVEILVLLVAVAATTVLFARREHLAAWLMAPYVAWVEFATALNLVIVAPEQSGGRQPDRGLAWTPRRP